jgi:hypothetical protein
MNDFEQHGLREFLTAIQQLNFEDQINKKTSINNYIVAHKIPRFANICNQTIGWKGSA